MEANGILTQQKAGFRENQSTETSLLNITNKWLINIDKGHFNGVIFLDLKKAFDCVNYEILLKKLMLYGCKGNTLHRFRSYLTNQIQMCKIGQTLSQSCYIKCGIPQGSNLGPLFFLIYMNDLPNCLSFSTTSMFVDDTNLTTNGKYVEDIQEHLNTDLEKVRQWFLANKLTLNKEKIEYMIIGSRQRLVKTNTNPTITLGEANIKQLKQTKTLGFIVDERLSWKNQISNIIAKVTSSCFSVTHLFLSCRFPPCPLFRPDFVLFHPSEWNKLPPPSRPFPLARPACVDDIRPVSLK